MRAPEEWAAFAYGPALATDKVVLQFIQHIQRDALEAAAKVCDHAVRYHSLKCRQALQTTRRDIADSHKSSSDTANDCARTIRALAAPTTTTGEKA